MADIFLSYASEDIDKARRLAHALAAPGWSVFWDRTIPAGKTWREQIGSELEDARCLVVAWSSTSVRSSWVQEEVDDARARGIPVLPVLFEEVSAPLGLRSIQGRDLSHWDYSDSFPVFRDLLADIARVLGAPPGDGRHDEHNGHDKIPLIRLPPRQSVALGVLAAIVLVGVFVMVLLRAPGDDCRMSIQALKEDIEIKEGQERDLRSAIMDLGPHLKTDPDARRQNERLKRKLEDIQQTKRDIEQKLSRIREDC